MNDRLTRLTRVLLLNACAQASVARTASRECDRVVKELEALLASWEAEDCPDGPLFGAERRRDGLIPPPAPPLPPQEKCAPAAQAPPLPRPQVRTDPRGVVEVVREWWVYRNGTTDQVGTVNATTEPSALARAIDQYGAAVWVVQAGKVQVEPAVAQVEPVSELVPPSWDAPCTFTVTLASGLFVYCTWHPGHAYAVGCGEPGRLEMRGPVSAEGFRAMPIPPNQRNEPLPDVARRRAQEAADVLAGQTGEEKLERPDWAAARKEDLASGAAKPRKKRKPAKGEGDHGQRLPAGKGAPCEPE